MIDLTDILTESLTELGCPGILCGIVYGDLVSTYSAGTISPQEHDRAFYLYSITKTFTATAILLLMEERGLSLDKPYSSFFPKTVIPADITIHQLLNHTSGLSDYFSSADYQRTVKEHPETPWSRERLMQVGLEKTPLFAPGAGWGYSNPGYALLRDLIELLSGQDVHACLQERILDPLAMKATRPFLEPDHDLQLLAATEPTITGDFRSRYSPGWILPECLISTVADTARFYHALFSGQVLSAAALGQMMQTVDVPFPLPAPLQAAYGLGVMHARNSPLGNAYGHGGGGPGYTTYAQCHPSLNGAPFALCFVLNRSLPRTPIEVADKICRAFLESSNSFMPQPTTRAPDESPI